MKVEDLAKELYSSYSEEVEGVSCTGVPLPSWEEFSTNPTLVKSYTAWLMITSKAIALVLAPKVIKETVAP